MNSPFPGMDPYIESCGMWEDFHADLLSEIKASLANSIPNRYLVRMGERAYVVLMPPDEAGVTRHMAQGDVSILQASSERTEGSGAVAVRIGH